MSLINEYLKKAQRESPSPDEPRDIPPLLKSGEGENEKRYVFPLIFVLAIVIFVSGVYFLCYMLFIGKSSPVLQKDELPPLATSFPFRQALAQKERRYNELPEGLVTIEIEHETETRNDQKESKEVSSSSGREEAKARDKEANQLLTKSEKPAQVVQASPPVQISPLVKKTEISMVEVDINHYYQLALMAQKEKDFPEAEKFYRRVLAKDPSHIEALTNLAAAYIHQNKFTDAERTLRKILQIEPKNAKALVNLGIINLKSNQYQQAKHYFQDALRADPKEETALVNLAFLAQRENDIPLTEKYYKQILSISPDNHEILLAYASLLEKGSRFAGALSCYQRSLETEEVKENRQLFDRIKERIRLLNYIIRENKGDES